MEKSLYSNLGLKINRTYREKKDEVVLTLKDFLEHKITIQNKEELRKIFSHELKIVLQKDNLFDLINSFFEFEANLNHVLELIDFPVNDFNFDNFYKNASPVIMRSLLENEQSADSAFQILKSIKESLRIVLEEELYQVEDHF